MENLYLGIDIAKDSFDVALVQAGKVVVKHYPNTPGGYARLDKWLAKVGAVGGWACMEATGRYWEALADHLHSADWTVSVVNPAQMRRTKTDPQDARLLAAFCAQMRPHRWYPPSPAMRELQALVHPYDSLKAHELQLTNRLAAMPPSSWPNLRPNSLLCVSPSPTSCARFSTSLTLTLTLSATVACSFPSPALPS